MTENVAELKKELETLRARESSREAIEGAGGNTRLLLPHVEDRVRRGEDPAQVVEELKGSPDFRPAFGNGRNGKPDIRSMSEKEKVDFITENGFDAYKQLLVDLKS